MFGGWGLGAVVWGLEFGVWRCVDLVVGCGVNGDG